MRHHPNLNVIDGGLVGDHYHHHHYYYDCAVGHSLGLHCERIGALRL